MDKYLKYDILAIIALPITLHMYTKLSISGYFRWILSLKLHQDRYVWARFVQMWWQPADVQCTWVWRESAYWHPLQICPHSSDFYCKFLFTWYLHHLFMLHIGIANKLSAITIFLFQIFVVERHNSSRQQSTYFNCFKIYLRLVAYNMSKFKSTNCT